MSSRAKKKPKKIEIDEASIKLPREIVGSKLWEKPEELRDFLLLLFVANHEDLVDPKHGKIKRGQVIDEKRGKILTVPKYWQYLVRK